MHILVATDLSARSDRAVRRGVDLAARHKAGLSVLSIVDDAGPEALTAQMVTSAETELRRFLASLPGGDAHALRVMAGDPTADLIEQVRAARPDLLVLGRHRDRPFLDLIHETTAGRLARLTPCPVLVVRDRVDHAYDRVLAATDFSPAAAAAISLAHDLAPGAAIDPVHAFHVPYDGVLSRVGGGTSDIEDSFRAEAAEADATWRARHALPETCGATRILPGSALEVLGTQARETGATLICAGAHGRVGQGRPLLGSVVTDLMRFGPCDLLIARPD